MINDLLYAESMHSTRILLKKKKKQNIVWPLVTRVWFYIEIGFTDDSITCDVVPRIEAEKKCAAGDLWSPTHSKLILSSQ